MDYTLVSPAAVFLLLSLLVSRYVVTRILRRRESNVHLVPRALAVDSAPLLGHELSVLQHDESVMYTRWIHEVAQVCRLKAAFGHDDLLLIADHAAARHVFAHTDTYIRAPAFRNHSANLIGQGLVWAEGTEHRSQRRVIAPCFATERVREMAPVVADATQKMIDRLAATVLESASSSRVVNISTHTTPCTLDIIARVSFGHEFFPNGHDTPTDDASSILSAWHAVVKNQDTLLMSCAIPLVRRFPWIGSLPIKALHAQGTAKTIITRLARDMLGRSDAELGGEDLFSRLIRGLRREDGEKGEKLSEEQVINNIVTFMLVGHETSTGVLNFTLLDLARHPAVQTRLRQEIVNCGGALRWDDIQSDRMPYLDAVVKEGLRLHPASPSTDRYVTHDDVIPLKQPIRGADGKALSHVRVRAGQNIIVSFKAMNVDKRVWGEDADMFRPERWLEPATAERPSGWNGILTFCDGPRNCVGYRLAVLELKLMLAMLVRAFVFADTGAEIHGRASPTLVGRVDGKIGTVPLSVSLAASEGI